MRVADVPIEHVELFLQIEQPSPTAFGDSGAAPKRLSVVHRHALAPPQLSGVRRSISAGNQYPARIQRHQVPGMEELVRNLAHRRAQVASQLRALRADADGVTMLESAPRTVFDQKRVLAVRSPAKQRECLTCVAFDSIDERSAVETRRLR